MGRQQKNKLSKAGHLRVRKEHMKTIARQMKMRRLRQRIADGGTVTEDEWLSCQNDDNKLVQRHNAMVLFIPDEVCPEEANDVADVKDIKLEKPCEIIDEVITTEEKYTEGNNDDEKSHNMNISPIQIPDEWVIAKLLCRGCHTEGDLISLQATDPIENTTYADMMATCFSIQLYRTYVEDALRAVCGLCAARLRDAYAFCQQVRACEERFHDLYSDNRIRVADTTDKIKVKEESAVASNGVPWRMIPYENSSELLVEHKVVPAQQNATSADAKQLKKTAPKRKTYKNLAKKDWPASLIKEYATRICNRTYKCKQCEKTFHRVKTVYRHNAKVHLNLPHLCQLCDKPFKTQALRRRHKLEEHNVDDRRKNKSFLCQLCKKPFKTNVQRKNHKLEEHNIDERYKCKACDKAFFTSRQLKTHRDSFHMLGEVFKCDMCDYECYNKPALQRHTIKHKTSKDFHCKYCNKSFLRRSTLHFHERIHTGDKRKSCAECGQAFVQKASLNYHMMKYHPEVKF